MKKKSNLIAILIALIFVVMPLASLTVNHIIKQNIDQEMKALVKEISKDNIHVLDVRGCKTSSGMLYAQNAWRTINVIKLGVTPAEMTIHNDTLRVILNDKSDVYQGAIMLGNLKSVIRNGEVTELKEH